MRTFLAELWGDKYGSGVGDGLREVWMDGGVETTDHTWIQHALATLQPNASVFNACCRFNGSLPPSSDGSRDPELAKNCVSPNPVTWVGTESGHSPDPTWSTGLQWGGGSSSSPTFSAREADTVLQKTQWFYVEGAELRSLPDLISSYETTVGRNSLFMIDFAPQPSGALHPLHVATYRALGDWIRTCYYTDTGRVANTSDIHMHWLASNLLPLPLPSPRFINRIVLQEDQTRGQAVRAWEVEAMVVGDTSDAGARVWTPLAAGQSIGHKHITVLPNATAVRGLRLRVVRANAELVAIRNFAAHFCETERE